MFLLPEQIGSFLMAFRTINSFSKVRPAAYNTTNSKITKLYAIA